MSCYRIKVELIDPTLEEFESIEEFYKFKNSRYRAGCVRGRVKELSGQSKLKWVISDKINQEETCFNNKKYTVDYIRII
jgi:hypothetical protein